MLYAGVDEVGRGCLAGPVVACAVILKAGDTTVAIDSKQCTQKVREQLAPVLRKNSIAWSLGVVWNEQIDVLNILQATFHAMAKAISMLSVTPDIVYIDGKYCIPKHITEAYSIPYHQEAIVRGDSLMQEISAASIIAKVFRDSLMVSLAKKYPNYGFDRHKGYGTKEHYSALRKYGACAIHRKTFAGVL